MNKQESQSQVSIIINGERYDSIQLDDYVHFCSGCDFQGNCRLSKSCSNLIGQNGIFKKSNNLESTEWIKIERDKVFLLLLEQFQKQFSSHQVFY